MKPVCDWEYVGKLLAFLIKTKANLQSYAAEMDLNGIKHKLQEAVQSLDDAITDLVNHLPEET